MPYVMPQQVKEKAGDHGTVFRESTGLDITFVRANHRCCFIEYAVDELMAVFCAERFRQFDRFVNSTLYGTSLRLDSSYSAMRSTAFSTCPSSSSRRDRYGFISPSRYAVLAATLPAAHGSTGRQRLYILFSQELVFNISDVVLGQLPGVERLDGTLTSAATSSRFHGFPLLISGLDGFQYINHFKRGQCSFCTFVASFGASTFDRLFNAFSGQNPKSNRNFAVLGNMRQAVACTTSDIFKVGSATTNNRTQRNHRVVFTGFSQCTCRQRQLIGTRHPNNGNVFIFT